MSDPKQDTGELSEHGSTRLERVVGQFEEGWQRGQRPAIDDYLPRDGDDRQAILVELVHADLECRAKTGEVVRVESYFERYPELAEDRSVARALIAAEYHLRRAANPQLAVEEYLARFPGDRDELGKVLLQTVSSAPPIAPARRAAEPAGAPDGIGDPRLPAPFGRFQLLAVAGRGGFGTVYRAFDPQLNRDVAIKIPRPGAFATRQEVDRFLREARAGARLRHPNICPVYDVGEFEGRHYIVMGFIEGSPLSAFLKAGRGVDWKVAAKLAGKLAGALAEAHEQGIVHRDLKPSNIMIEAKRREPVILDFGLAKEIQGQDSYQTQSGQVLGTPLYMSPEQARGAISQIGPKSDIYSLGVVLYQMVAGRPPFHGAPAEVFMQILSVTPEPPSSHAPGLAPAIDAVCLKAMAKDPAARFASMGEFGEAIKGLLKGASSEPAAARGTAPAAPRAREEAAPAPGVRAVRPDLGTLPSSVANSIGMRLALVPPGEYLMGSPDSDPEAQENERPQHPVRITRPFYLGVSPVTQAEFEKVLAQNPSHFKGAPSCPVETVSWQDAKRFCEALSALPEEKKAQRLYRLPTEAEWEHACRAGSAAPYGFGADVRSLSEYAWFDQNAAGRTHPAGEKKPNAWGLHDMHGNVWEWCADWYAGQHRRDPAEDPQGPTTGDQRVIRGGSWVDSAANLRSAVRAGYGPRMSYYGIGFRVLLVLS